MKTLKNESSIYREQIISAVQLCYAETDAPTDRALMQLYTVIGERICAQGEKAFVVHLAEALAKQFPQRKGFSPRNLRRMRDFYRFYKNSPSLMAQAMELGWTQNTMILECCETNEQRSFYMRLAAEKLNAGSASAPARKLGVDRFHWPVAGVLVLLVAESLIGTRRRLREVGA